MQKPIAERILESQAYLSGDVFTIKVIVENLKLPRETLTSALNILVANHRLIKIGDGVYQRRTKNPLLATRRLANVPEIVVIEQRRELLKKLLGEENVLHQ